MTPELTEAAERAGWRRVEAYSNVYWQDHAGRIVVDRRSDGRWEWAPARRGATWLRRDSEAEAVHDALHARGAL